jgi:chorismate mutase
MNRFSLQDLARCREQIDELDRALLAILNERTAIVERIGRIKQELQLAIYEPKREDQVFDNVIAHNGGPLTHDAVKRIFERIIDEMRTVQKLKMLEKGRQ